MTSLLSFGVALRRTVRDMQQVHSPWFVEALGDPVRIEDADPVLALEEYASVEIDLPNFDP